MLGTDSRSGPALSVHDLCKRFGDRVAFHDVSFEIGYGEIFGFLSYIVYAAVLVAVEVLAARAVAEALLQVPEILAQLVFTPLVASVSIWIGMAISTRSSDPRTAQQLGTVAGLPTVAVAALIAYNVIHPTLGVAIGLGVFLVLLNAVSWELFSALLDRERLITGTK